MQIPLNELKFALIHILFSEELFLKFIIKIFFLVYKYYKKIPVHMLY